jgi:hypothetical protein
VDSDTPVGPAGLPASNIRLQVDEEVVMRALRRGPGLLAVLSTLAGSVPGAAVLAAGAPLFTVTPCRLVDTRTGSPLLANTPRTYSLRSGCAISPTAVSIVANLTVVGPTAPGALVVHPTGASNPGTSTLNFTAGAIRANNAHLLLDTGGSATFTLAASTGATAHLLVDVVGYYASSASPFSIGGATVRQRINATGPNTGTLTSSAVSTLTGSLFLSSIARGMWANAPTAPTDNQSNVYSILGTTHTYLDYPTARTAVYHKLAGQGGPAHTFSVTWGPVQSGGGGDEVTVSAVEVRGATSVDQTTWVERAAAATISGLPTSISGPGILVSFCWGSGQVGTTHDFRPAAGWTRIDAATATGDPSGSGYIQVAVAYKIVTGPTTETVSWSNIVTPEGAQIYTIALR